MDPADFKISSLDPKKERCAVVKKSVSKTDRLNYGSTGITEQENSQTKTAIGSSSSYMYSQESSENSTFL